MTLIPIFKRALIIYAEHFTHHCLADAFRKAGFIVIPDCDNEKHADGPIDGPQGLKTLKQTLPDLVVLGLVLEPRGKDEGYYFLKDKNKKEAIKKIPVIICSAHHSKDILKKYQIAFPDVKTYFAGLPFKEELFVKAAKTILTA
jgi:CheY-like chemotaxis protein